MIQHELLSQPLVCWLLLSSLIHSPKSHFVKYSSNASLSEADLHPASNFWVHAGRKGGKKKSNDHRMYISVFLNERGTKKMKRNDSFTCIIETNQLVTKMSSLNYHDCPWRATADLVRGSVSSHVSAWLLALSRYTSIIRCLLSCFDWTSRYRRASSKTITTQGLLKTASSATLLP